jgi:hypothetical protein
MPYEQIENLLYICKKLLNKSLNGREFSHLYRQFEEKYTHTNGRC